MAHFNKFKRKDFTDFRPVTEDDITQFKKEGYLITNTNDTNYNISISQLDRLTGSPKIGDMIARNPKNHSDQWLVAEQYFKENFEKL